MFFFFHRFLRVDFRLVSRTYFSFVSGGEGNPGIPLDFNVPSLVSFAYIYSFLHGIRQFISHSFNRHRSAD